MKDLSEQWDGEKYSKNSQPQYKAAMSIIDQFKFNGDEKILDVGCGDGKITYQIALRVPRGDVLGIDNSISMMQFAKEKYGAIRNLNFELRDAQDLDYKNKFDIMFSMFCLQWVPNKSLAFKQIQQSLKPHGKAALIMPFRNQEVLRLREKMMSEEPWKAYFIDYFDPSNYIADIQYERYAKEAGLLIHSYVSEPVTLSFQDRQAFTAFLSNITPLNCISDANKQIEFMDELVARYLETVPPAKDGTCQITYTYAKMLAGLVQ